MSIKRLKQELGYCGLFAERPTMKQAYEYANDVAESFGKKNAIYVLTAVAVVHNTLISQLVKDFVVIPREFLKENRGFTGTVEEFEQAYLAQLEHEVEEALTAKE